ncbi:MAG: N4-gp56 family major capsid protein [Pseudomonadota bacterium]
MALTTINNLTAETKWSSLIFQEALAATAFNKGAPFMGTGPENIIQINEDLGEGKSGNQIKTTLFMRLRGQGVTGDNVMEGQEEQLVSYEMAVYINQLRNSVKLKGRMEEKKTKINLRKQSKTALRQWLAEYSEQLIFDHLCGNTAATFGQTATAPLPASGNNNRLLYGGDATTKATIATTTTFGAQEIDRMVTYAKISSPKIQPVSVEGGTYFVLFVHPYQANDLRNDSRWLNAMYQAADRGLKNPIFSGALGIYNGVVVYENERILTGSDAGSDSLQPWARAILLGRQAAILAKGGGDSWNEETDDRGNQQVYTIGSIFGVKKSVFPIDGSDRDLGVIACDTYATVPAGVAH